MNFLREEVKRSTQICEIEVAEVVETMEEIKAMREDIEQNVEKIVDEEELQEENYIECMAYYIQPEKRISLNPTRRTWERGSIGQLYNCRMRG